MKFSPLKCATFKIKQIQSGCTFPKQHQLWVILRPILRDNSALQYTVNWMHDSYWLHACPCSVSQKGFFRNVWGGLSQQGIPQQCGFPEEPQPFPSLQTALKAQSLLKNRQQCVWRATSAWHVWLSNYFLGFTVLVYRSILRLRMDFREYLLHLPWTQKSK